MSDLCRQCTNEIWGEEGSDFEIVPPTSPYAEVAQQNLALCESCGLILVNGEGSCIDPACKLHGNAITKTLLEEEKKFWQRVREYILGTVKEFFLLEMTNQFFFIHKRGTWLFRIFGVGLQWATYAEYKPYFSERNGYRRPLIKTKKWRIFFLEKRRKKSKKSNPLRLIQGGKNDLAKNPYNLDRC